MFHVRSTFHQICSKSCSIKDFDRLGPWCTARQGLTIVYENPEATWLPFQSLGNFKTSHGHVNEGVFIQRLLPVKTPSRAFLIR